MKKEEKLIDDMFEYILGFFDKDTYTYPYSLPITCLGRESFSYSYEDKGPTKRVLNTVKKLDIKYIGDLVQLNEVILLRVSGCGKKTLNEMKELLASGGFAFGVDKNDSRLWIPKEVLLFLEVLTKNFHQYSTAHLANTGHKNDWPDMVNHPPHYKQGEIECIDGIEASMSAAQFEGYLKGNVMKYIWRYGTKDQGQDLEKANWYLLRLISHVKTLYEKKSI